MQQTPLDYLKFAHPTWSLWKEYPVANASKAGTGNAGRIDIIAFDEAADQWFIWEVKARRGSDAKAAGAEEHGPKDIAGYIFHFEEEYPGAKIKAGPSIAQQLTQQDPVDKESTLVTTSATANGRPTPEYDGVIVYWTRKKQKDDEKSNLPYSLEASAAATRVGQPTRATEAEARLLSAAMAGLEASHARSRHRVGARRTTDRPSPRPGSVVPRHSSTA